MPGTPSRIPIRLLLPLAAGAAVAALVVLSGGSSGKNRSFGLTAAMLPFLAVLSGSPKRLMIFCFFLLSPVNISYYLFGLTAPHIGGAFGLYLVPLDLPLAGLYALWFWQKAIAKRPPARRSWLLPLLFGVPILASLPSVIGTVNHAWALYELIRYLRVLAILAYFSRNLQTEDVPLVAASVAVAVLIQGGMAVLQLATDSDLRLSAVGIWGPGSGEIFQQQLSETEMTVRAGGTTGHPVALGTYFMFMLPLVASLTLLAGIRRLRLLAGAALVAGLAGLLATMTRGTIAAALLALPLLLALWVQRRWINLLGAAVITVWSLVFLAIVGLLVWDVAAKRVGWDIRESYALRMAQNDAAFRMFVKHPVFGAGINNYTQELPAIDPRLAEDQDYHVGVLVAVHNLYLLVLAETGIVGFLGFGVCGMGVLIMGYRAARGNPDLPRALAAGLFVGTIAAAAHGLMEFSMLLDTSMYTYSALAGLLTVIGSSPVLPQNPPR